VVIDNVEGSKVTWECVRKLESAFHLTLSLSRGGVSVEMRLCFVHKLLLVVKWQRAPRINYVTYY
jgi:hypothetical protein